MILKRFLTRRTKTGENTRPAGSAPSIVTADVDIEGNLVSSGELQIDGNVHGHVRAHAAVIDVNGVVHGGVVAEEVMVRGRVIGPVRGLHVHVFASAHVEGDVISSTLSIENGAWIEGAIHRSDDPLSEPASRYRAGSWPLPATYRKPHGDDDADEGSAPRPAPTIRKAGA